MWWWWGISRNVQEVIVLNTNARNLVGRTRTFKRSQHKRAKFLVESEGFRIRSRGDDS
jgi:kynureninase